MRQAAAAHECTPVGLLASVLAIGALLLGGGGCSSPGSDAPSDAPRQQAAAADSVAAASPDSVTAAPPTATDRGRTVEERVEDAALAARVKTALVENRRLRPFDFDPRVTDGRVTLTGDVDARAQGRLAADVAAGVEGVADVLNRLTVSGQQVAWTPPSSSSPAGRDDGQQEVASSEAPPGPGDGAAEGETYHTVQTGESLWAVAQEYGTSVSRVRALNDLRGSDLQPGERLLVQRGGSGNAPESSSSGEGPAVADAGNAPPNGNAQPSSGTQQSGNTSQNGADRSAAAGAAGSETTTYHTVERGDTLYDIARANDMSVARLKELNGLSGSGLMPGDRLRVE
jgi:LysM repeat protein